MNSGRIGNLLEQYFNKEIDAFGFARQLKEYGINTLRARWHNEQMHVAFVQSKNNICQELHKVTFSSFELDEQKSISLAGPAYWASGISTDASMPQNAHRRVYATELLHKHKASHRRYAA